MKRWFRWLLYVVPAAVLIIPESLHPNPFALGSVFQSVSPVVDWWIELHLLFVVFFTLMALALFVCLDGQSGLVATLARLAIGAFVAATNAFVGTEGVGMGLVIRGAQGMPAAQVAGVDQAVESLWNSAVANSLGITHAWLWVVAIGLTAVSLYRAARRPLPLALIGLAFFLVLVEVGLQVSGVTLIASRVGLFVAIVAAVGALDRAAIGPFGMLMVAMLVPQHGSVVGAVGAASVGIALVWRELNAQLMPSRAAQAGSPAGAEPMEAPLPVS